MKEVEFLGVRCNTFDRIEALLNNKYTIFVHGGRNYTFARLGKDGYKLVDENYIAKEYLYSGRGVCCGDFIYFKATESPSITFKRFQVSYAKAKEKLEKTVLEQKSYLGGTLYDSLNDKTDFILAKTMLMAYVSKTFTEDIMLPKVEKYLKPGTLEIVIQAINNNSNKEEAEVV